MTSPEIKKASSTVRFSPATRIAAGIAAAVSVLALLGWLYYSAARSGDSSDDSTMNFGPEDIAPGGNGATLTLSNGQVIALSGAKSGVVIGTDLTYDDLTAVISGSSTSSQKNAKGSLNDPEQGASPAAGNAGNTAAAVPEMNSGEVQGLELQGREVHGGKIHRGNPDGSTAQLLVASTSKGQTYKFTLPDGTKVWLNADSRISFPARFNGIDRKVLLIGEAYFAVKHDAKKRFRVESRGQVVEDIGTEFNVSAYPDARYTKTTLAAGVARVLSVPHHDKFSHAPGNMSYGSEEGTEPDVILNPGEQATLQGIHLRVNPVNSEEIADWKKGNFTFRNEPLSSIMSKISRWYNVDLEYAPGLDLSRTFSGSISRNRPVSAILDLMQADGQIQFKIRGKKISVEK